jgi:hypothetical protein
MKVKFFCLLAVLTIATSVWAEEWNRSFTVGSHPQLRVETSDASIAVTGAGGNTIAARVVADGLHIGSDVAVKAEQNGDSVVLRVKIPDHHFVLNFRNRPVRVEVSVPRATVLDLASSDGSVRVSGIAGETRLRTSDGSVQVENFDGTLRAHTSDGSVKVMGRFDLLDLRTGDGSMRVEAQNGSRMKGEWRLHTSDGSVVLRLPADFAADLDASTSDGHVDLQLPVEVTGRMDRTHVHGKLHGGGPSLEIHTSDGSITLQSL